MSSASPYRLAAPSAAAPVRRASRKGGRARRAPERRSAPPRPPLPGRAAPLCRTAARDAARTLSSSSTRPPCALALCSPMRHASPSARRRCSQCFVTPARAFTPPSRPGPRPGRVWSARRAGRRPRAARRCSARSLARGTTQMCCSRCTGVGVQCPQPRPTTSRKRPSSATRRGVPRRPVPLPPRARPPLPVWACAPRLQPYPRTLLRNGLLARTRRCACSTPLPTRRPAWPVA
mmetsp:Transcript_8629/g.25477  ORF Transcript_8629/g.25477 Transcript_8629/m.25477 type:complete len:234 (+) Transcript_8629:1-702(+)